ncbi:MAG: ADP-glyceromanno-heptose 6-epimerase [Hyphomonadaceae bacterium]|nr:ADP-glyceromanno-heptose 6-epimerase [Hyphomonadaceae bacterium]
MAADLAQRGEDVVICDWLGSADKWHNLNGVRLSDIVFPEDLKGWLGAKGSRLAAIVHMGAISSTTEPDLDKIVRNNIQLSLSLWEWSAEHRVPFIYASSAATYGSGAQGFDDNETPEALSRLVPLNAYGWSKHVIDRRFIADINANRPRPPQWAGLKFFNVYGPNEAHKNDMRSVVHKIYPKVALGEDIELFKSHDPRYADGGQLRDFIYVRDCVKIVRWLLETPRVSGLFNVGTGEARSFHDLALAVGAAVGRQPRIRYVDMPPTIRDKYQYFTQANMRKLRECGYADALAPLEEGVSDYVVGYLQPKSG